MRERMFKETQIDETSLKVEQINEQGQTRLIGFYSPQKLIFITPRRELAEYLILKKNYKFHSVIAGEKISEKPRFYFVLINSNI